jgi:hypothetical protein
VNRRDFHCVNYYFKIFMMTAARQHYSVSIIPSGLVLNKAEKDLSQVGVVSPNLCEKEVGPNPATLPPECCLPVMLVIKEITQQ